MTTADPASDAAAQVAAAQGESRVPVAITLLVALALPLVGPDEFAPGPRWLLPILVLALSVVEFSLDPGRIDDRSPSYHWLRIAIVAVLIFYSGWATIALVSALVTGSTPGVTNSAAALLRSGGVVWLSVMIAFTFLYWELDLGGPGERVHSERVYPDIAFPQELSSGVAPPHWRPTFVDYLYLSLTSNLAFSPTDAMPLSHWAKLAMGLQELTSLLIIGLVIARAVNILQ